MKVREEQHIALRMVERAIRKARIVSLAERVERMLDIDHVRVTIDIFPTGEAEHRSITHYTERKEKKKKQRRDNEMKENAK